MRCVNVVTMVILPMEPLKTVSPVPVPCWSPVTTLPQPVPYALSLMIQMDLYVWIVRMDILGKDVNGRWSYLSYLYYLYNKF